MKCRKCNTDIKFIKTEKGKNMPVDSRLVTIVTEDGKVVKGYIPHWATCSDPDYFRR